MTDYDKIEQVKQIIEELLAQMGLKATVEFEESITKGLVYNINMPDPFLLIGRQGTTLHSFQILAQALVARRLKLERPLWFMIDVDDHKRKREWYLKETAKGAVEQLKRVGRPVALEPMPNYDRRFVHAYLQDNAPEVESSSVGHDPHRKIVIRLKS